MVGIEEYIRKNSNTQSITKSLVIDEYEFDFDGMAINYSALSTEEKKNVEKLIRLKNSDHILEVLKFREVEFDQIKGIGSKFINSILVLKDRLQIELKKISSSEIDYKNMGSELIISTRFKEMSIDEIGSILLEDIDNFLDGINESDQDIFQCRWGFIESELTLEKIGLKYHLTRERIRQKAETINNNLIRNMRLTQENIWLNLKDNINLQLQFKMKDLLSCFDNEGNFYKFLDYVCGGKNIKKTIRPDIAVDMLNVFFATHGASCSIIEIKEYIQNNISIEYFCPDNVLEYLDELGKVTIKDNMVHPKNLKKNEAAACILSEHSQGLPWLDVAKIVNVKNISRTNLNETRIDNQAFFDSDFLYLAGKGVYKNTKFMDFSEINIDLIFESLLVFFDKTNRTVFHLNEVYRNSKFLQKQDYYIIRYIVKMYGEDYGFYFDGKSQTDSVGVEKRFKNITQREVILQAMVANKRAMTKAEIACLLKSNSLAHASVYLDEMIKKKQVVQVDRMLYTIPDIAFADIELDKYLCGIQDVLNNEKRPIDPSVFKGILNDKLHASYSKCFYASIAKIYHQEKNWYRKKELYSLHEIQYENLRDAINIHCQSELDISSNFRNLSKYISITKESAQRAIRNWQLSLIH